MKRVLIPSDGKEDIHAFQCTARKKVALKGRLLPVAM